MQFIPQTVHTAQRHLNYRLYFYGVCAVIVAGMLVHIEIGFGLTYAPESVLVRMQKTQGILGEQSQCFADIISDTVNEKKKPLKLLDSLYDYINLTSFYVSTDKGFFLLETGLVEYQDIFEIRIVCYTSNLDGVAYTIINNANQKGCDIKNSGKIVVC